MAHTSSVFFRLALGLLGMLAAGCGGQAPGTEQDGPTGPDTTPPRIVSRYPPPAAVNISTQTTINIEFSEALDLKTITAANISLTQALLGPVQTTLEYDTKNKVLTIRPVILPLKTDTHFTVQLSEGLKDEAGNRLVPEDTVAWRFTTGLTFDDMPPRWSDAPNLEAEAVKFNEIEVRWYGATPPDPAAVDLPSGSWSELIYTVLYKRPSDAVFGRANSGLGASSLTIDHLIASTPYEIEILVTDPAGNEARLADKRITVTTLPAGRLYVANFIPSTVSVVPDVGQATGNKDAEVVSADQTTLRAPSGIAVNAEQGLVYVADPTLNSISAYPLQTEKNGSPVRLGEYGVGHNIQPEWVIRGKQNFNDPNTSNVTELWQPSTLWLDPVSHTDPTTGVSRRYLYAANLLKTCGYENGQTVCRGSIVVFDVNQTVAGPNHAPATVIKSRDFQAPIAFAIDYSRKKLYVANRDLASGLYRGYEIMVLGFSNHAADLGATNDPPSGRSFWGASVSCSSPLGICGPTAMAIDEATDRLYLVNREKHNLLVFSDVSQLTTSGEETPAMVQVPAAEGMEPRPVGMFLDATTRRLYVTTDKDQSLQIFDADEVANPPGTVLPLRTIRGTRTMLGQASPNRCNQASGVFAVAVAGDRAYLATPGSYPSEACPVGVPPAIPNIAIFNVSPATPSTPSNIPPEAVLVNPLQGITGSALDTEADRLYLSSFHANMILVYEGASALRDGRRDPDRIIAGPATRLDHPVSLLFVPAEPRDATHTGSLYVVNQSSHSVAVFEETFDASGQPYLKNNVAPTRYIGPSSDGTDPFTAANLPQMVYPFGIALDHQRDILYVSNRDADVREDAKGRRIVAFLSASTISGNVAPTWKLEGDPPPAFDRAPVTDLTTLQRPSGLLFVEDPDLTDSIADDRLFIANRVTVNGQPRGTILGYRGLSQIVIEADGGVYAEPNRPPTWTIALGGRAPIGLALHRAVHDLYVSDGYTNAVLALNIEGLSPSVAEPSIAQRVIAGGSTGLTTPYGLVLDPDR